MGKACGVWRSSLDGFNDCKSVGHEKTVFGRLPPKIWVCVKSNMTVCAEHPAVPSREEHRRTGTTFLFTGSCSV